MEVLVVAALLGIFASIVVPGLSQSRAPVGTQLEHALEADLRLARTEAIARARPTVVAVSTDGGSWWIADAAHPETPIADSLRSCGKGALHPLDGVTIDIKRESIEAAGTSPAALLPSRAQLLAWFDALGTRDEATVEIAARVEGGAIAAQWTILAGRTRLSHLPGN